MKYILSFILSLTFFLSITPLLHSHMVSGSGCSVSNTGYLAELVKEYERQTGEKLFMKGGGSHVAVEDLRGGNVDFAASCRGPMKDDPKGVIFVQVAWDALVFIVHKSNMVEDISRNEIRAVYNGKIKDWGQLKGGNAAMTIFVSKPRSGLSGVEAALREFILQGKEPVIAKNVVSLASTAIVEQMVEKTTEGFGATGFSSARKRYVKILKVGGVIPTKENIIAKKYPFARPLYILLPEKPKAEVKKFLDYVLSPEGQKFISSLGAISLTDMK